LVDAHNPTPEQHAAFQDKMAHAYFEIEGGVRDTLNAVELVTIAFDNAMEMIRRNEDGTYVGTVSKRAYAAMEYALVQAGAVARELSEKYHADFAEARAAAGYSD
jgi:hypothetical protein